MVGGSRASRAVVDGSVWVGFAAGVADVARADRAPPPPDPADRAVPVGLTDCDGAALCDGADFGGAAGEEGTAVDGAAPDAVPVDAEDVDGRRSPSGAAGWSEPPPAASGESVAPADARSNHVGRSSPGVRAGAGLDRHVGATGEAGEPERADGSADRVWLPGAVCHVGGPVGRAGGTGGAGGVGGGVGGVGRSDRDDGVVADGRGANSGRGRWSSSGPPVARSAGAGGVVWSVEGADVPAAARADGSLAPGGFERSGAAPGCPPGCAGWFGAPVPVFRGTAGARRAAGAGCPW
ncbi:hypothetical protein [Frankia sp. EAN1pec]|uniref:hypothetical protein n=1 Tax=Parafrankia sp. (strain EAN1pec) TaxID=298653 RepID=UPI0012F97CC0